MTMEKKLFNRLKESMSSFNTGNMLDVPLNGGFDLEPLPTMSARHMRPSMWVITNLQTVLEQYAPNTRERWISAINLLRYLGYTVKWEDHTKCPEVFWVNTEGNAEDEAAYINDVFNRDYIQEKLDATNNPNALSGEQVYAFMKESMANAGHEVILIDSISQDSTVKS